MLLQWQIALMKAQETPRCGAKTRAEISCQSPAMKNGRCRMHGGKSPGAPTGHRHGMYKHGRYTRNNLDTLAVIKQQLEKVYSVL
ncbi:HGGxSTG domain-containing protein [Candidatus Odyssella thessalonicensis]|uniref:HGGxSTG domain-containing protein n=1 Tax=Candidatus Odyssella thessalonicensis TaxID=84647 RepID=UPI000225ACAA|nr:HGGxSTG domain-containing protein [Candidatus Odyssella thessalonicensis]